MAKKISELPTLTAVNDGDYLIVNDGDIDTRKIEFNNFANKFVRTDQDSTISGSLTLVSGTLQCQNLTLESGLLTVDTNSGRIGVGTFDPQTELDVHGNIQISNGLQLRFASLTNDFSVSFQAASLVESSNYALPSQVPVANSSALVCDQSGEMYWVPTATSFINGATMASFISATPTTSSSPGEKGQMVTDNNYLYICREDNIWARIALDSASW